MTNYKEVKEYPGFEKIPKFQVNLDLKPKERWTHIINAYLEPLKDFSKYLHESQTELFGSTSIVQHLLGIINNIQSTQQDIYEEMLGISEITKEVGLSFEDILSLNIGYDLLAKCTSGNIQDPKKFNGVFHFRNMDWYVDLKKIYVKGHGSFEISCD
jgi:hypothetical protein